MPRSEELQFTFRRAKTEDIPAVRGMIQELADFENASDGPKLSVEELTRDAGLSSDDGADGICHIYVLDCDDKATAGTANKTQTIGYAVCFVAYSTWRGKAYFLEDLYVRPAFRRKGAGSCLFHKVAAKAVELKCKRLDFHVLAWNPACEFYLSLGAVNMTETEQCQFYRIEEDKLRALVAN